MVIQAQDLEVNVRRLRPMTSVRGEHAIAQAVMSSPQKGVMLEAPRRNSGVSRRGVAASASRDGGTRILMVSGEERGHVE